LLIIKFLFKRLMVKSQTCAGSCSTPWHKYVG
jgi:hypothetical protein